MNCGLQGVAMNSETNNAVKLQEQLYKLTEKITMLVNKDLADLGDKEEYSQRAAIINRINALESAISGIYMDDLK